MAPRSAGRSPRDPGYGDRRTPAGVGASAGPAAPVLLRPGDELRLSTVAEAGCLASVRKAACEFAERHGVTRPRDVALAIDEACANVIVHAYRDQPPGPLHLTGVVDTPLVLLTIADEGCGLAPRADSPGLGLGLPIIARVTDHYQITGHAPTGTQVTMGFVHAPPRRAEDETFKQFREEITAALREGCALDSLQERIDGAPLSSGQRDALWLLAWATVER